MTGWEDYSPTEVEQIKQEKLRLKLARLAAEGSALTGLAALADPERARDWLHAQPAPLAELNLSEKDIDRLSAVANVIADDRVQKDERMRRALLAGNNEAALNVAREICGIEVEDEEGNRAAARVH